MQGKTILILSVAINFATALGKDMQQKAQRPDPIQYGSTVNALHQPPPTKPAAHTPLPVKAKKPHPSTPQPHHKTPGEWILYLLSLDRWFEDAGDGIEDFP